MRTNESIVTRKKVVRGKFQRNFLARLIGRLLSWRRCRQAVRELQALTDVQLRDIGIERYEIRNAVMHGGNYTRLRPTKTSSAVAPLKKAAA